MNVLWTILKVALALALVIPVSIVVLATALGIFGALMGLAFLVLRVAVVALIAYGAFKLLSRLFRGRAPAPVQREMPQLAPRDPHYDAAMRELDRELGHSTR